MKKRLVLLLLAGSLMLTGCSKLDRIIDILLEKETEIAETEQPADTEETEPTGTETPSQPEETQKPVETEKPAETEKPETTAPAGSTDAAEPPTEESADIPWVGCWMCEYTDKEVYLYLYLLENGTVRYTFLPFLGGATSDYGGYWKADDSTLTLDMAGGVFDPDSGNVLEPVEFDSVHTFTWDNSAKTLTLKQKSGSALYAGSDKAKLVFKNIGTDGLAIDPLAPINVAGANVSETTVPFVGSWTCTYFDGSCDNYLSFILAENGQARYSYGPANAGMAEMFGGSWKIEDHGLVLELEGGVFDMELNCVPDAYSFKSDYAVSWNAAAKTLYLTLRDGVSLYSGADKDMLVFVNDGSVPEDFDPFRGIYIYEDVNAEFCGEWYATYLDATDSEMAMSLLLNPDGSAKCRNGYVSYKIVEEFTGTWALDSDNRLTLDLLGGSVYADDESEYYKNICTYEWELYGNTFVLAHKGGGVLIPGTEGQSVECLGFDFTLYDGEWVTFGDVTGEMHYYDLQLLTNGEAIYTISTDAGTKARYSGWWHRYTDTTMDLNMELIEGEGTASINTTYETDWETFPTALILKLKDGGFALSMKMAANGQDTFSWIDPNAVG